MPPPAPKVSPEKVYKFLSDLEPGTYVLDITPDFEPHLVIEGAAYFAAGDVVVTVYKKRDTRS